jgi:hypothetical protein
MNDNHLIHPNLALAREHFEKFAWDCFATLEIVETLESKFEDEGDGPRPSLPGDTLSDIVANLHTALNLCREPAARPSTGRNRELRQRVTASERKDLALCIRVCLALLGAGCSAGAQP